MRRIIAGIFLSFILLWFSDISYAFKPLKEYSSLEFEQIITSSSLPSGVSSKVYIRGKDARVETNMFGKKTIMYIIDSKDAYMYYPDINAITTVPLKPKDMPQDNLDFLNKPGIKLVGKETVDAKECDVYQYVDEKQHDVKIWVDKSIDFPVKMLIGSEKGDIEIAYKNIKLNQPLDNNLFVIPSNANSIDINKMMEGFKGMADKFKNTK